MFELGHNKWFCTNLDKRVGIDVVQIKEPFSVKFNIKQKIQDLSFQDAADFTAKYISAKYKNIYLSFSGGLDSEFVGSVLIRNKINFVPVIIKINNESEFWHASKFCAENKLEPIIYDFSNKAFEYFKLMLTSCFTLKKQWSVGYSSNIVMKLLNDPTANILTGAGDPFRESETFLEPMGDILKISEHDFYLDYEYADQHPSSFFSYTPEIFRSAIQEIDTSLNSQIAKAKLYGLLPRGKTQHNLDALRYQLIKSYPQHSEKFDKMLYFYNNDLINSSKYYFIEKDKLLEQLEYK